MEAWELELSGGGFWCRAGAAKRARQGASDEAAVGGSGGVRTQEQANRPASFTPLPITPTGEQRSPPRAQRTAAMASTPPALARPRSRSQLIIWEDSPGASSCPAGSRIAVPAPPGESKENRSESPVSLPNPHTRHSRGQ